MSNKKILIIGISGPSSSGKSTLARLFTALFPKAFILYEDDFFKPEAEIPVKDGLEDWDSPEAIDFAALNQVIDYIKETHHLPEGFVSKEDQNFTGEPPVTVEEAREVKRRIFGEQDSNFDDTEMCIVDGFMLYNDDQLLSKFDMRILLRGKYEKMKARREARNGYATLEGFWRDPPGYFDTIVWPGYVQSHKHLFNNGDVNGELNELAISNGINTVSSLDMHMKDILEWALNKFLCTFGARTK
ncbi:P-loop containing nucleoside triphosphate hydrolase protein [Dipodascopsis uninucleata]